MQTIIRYGKQFIQYVRNNQAVSALEYAILIGIVAVAIGAALFNLGDAIKKTVEKADAKVDEARGRITN